MSGFSAVGFFLLSLVFELLTFTLWLRIDLRYLRVSPLNPISHLIYSVTNPILYPFHFLVKSKVNPRQRYDWLAFVVLVGIEVIKIICLSLIIFHTIIPIYTLLLYVVADLIIQPCNILFYAILIRVIMSFVNPGWRHPAADLLRILTEPLLILGKKIIPDISGFDFSPFIIMIILKVITLFIKASLPWSLLTP